MRPQEVHYLWHEALVHEAPKSVTVHVASQVDWIHLLDQFFYWHEAALNAGDWVPLRYSTCDVACQFELDC